MASSVDSTCSWLDAEAARIGRCLFFSRVIRQPGLKLRRRAVALRHLKSGYSVTVAVDDGEAVLQRDLMLAQECVDRFAVMPSRGECGSASRGMQRALVGERVGWRR